MDVSDVSAGQRFAIGVILTVIGPMLGQPNLGLLTQISGIFVIFGIGFLGAALEPPFTNALGADEWEHLSTGKQIGVLFVLAVVAVVLWFAVGMVQSVVANAI